MAKGDRDVFMNQWARANQGQANAQNMFQQNLYKQLYGYDNPGFGSAMTPTQGSILGQAQSERQPIISGYQGIAGSPYGGLNPQVIQNIRQMNATPLQTGNIGVNPQTESQILSNVARMQNVGWNPTDLGTARNALTGLQGNIQDYQNFANTGGMSAQDMANFRARSNAPITSYYQNQQNELARLGNQAQGNPYAIAAARNQLARQGGQAISDVSQGTEANLTNLLNQYKLAGLTGVQQGLATQAQLAEQLAQGQAATQLYGLQGAQAGLGQLSGQQLQAAMSNQEQQLRAALASRQLSQQGEQFIGQTGAESQLEALRGLTGIYGTQYGPAAGMQQLLGQSILGGGQVQNDYLRTLLLGLGGIPTTGQQVFSNILGGAGAGASVLSGLGGLSKLFGGGGGYGGGDPYSGIGAMGELPPYPNPYGGGGTGPAGERPAP